MGPGWPAISAFGSVSTGSSLSPKKDVLTLEPVPDKMGELKRAIGQQLVDAAFDAEACVPADQSN
jgi:hypothetical protein